jgi:glycerol-3-phosphate dehydrogenase
VIERDLDALESGVFDVAVIGGGIHGVALALDAARRGLRVALVEKNDFGSGSSGNSLRILHGGLRYLQTMDLPRFRDSVVARKWYAANFPQLVRPLPCLMPLYGRGLKRPSVMRMALAANDALASSRNDGLADNVRLPPGRVLTRSETIERFPAVRQQGLAGAALWYDYQMLSSERILMEMLRWAVQLGTVAANYVEVARYESDHGRFTGVVAADRSSGREIVIRAPLLVNAGGSASPRLAALAGHAATPLSPPSMAFNVLFDSGSMGDSAMAVAAPQPGAAVHFICPSRHGVWAGTAHLPRPAGSPPAPPSEQEIARFVADLRSDVPDFAWSDAVVRKVYSGFVPVSQPMTAELAVRADVVEVGGKGSGLFAVVGIKYTTATQVAQRALRWAFDGHPPAYASRSAVEAPPAAPDSSALLTDGDAAAALPRAKLIALVRDVGEREAAVTADDFFERRTNWGFTARDPQQLRAIVEEAYGEAGAPWTAEPLKMKG